MFLKDSVPGPDLCSSYAQSYAQFTVDLRESDRALRPRKNGLVEILTAQGVFEYALHILTVRPCL